MDKKRRNYDNFWNMDFNDIFKAFTEEFNQMKGNFDTELQEGGPITFGYSMRIGSDTDYKPEIRQWGNINDYRQKQGLPAIEWPFQQNLKPQIQSASLNDYFVDIIEEDESFKIIVEIPGFTKENLKEIFSFPPIISILSSSKKSIIFAAHFYLYIIGAESI